jgi:hypothetical protein
LRSFPEKVGKRLRRTLDDLEDDLWPDNLDVTPLVGHKPWLRVRDGNYRIFMRPMTDDEHATFGVELPDVGYVVGRIIDKKDARKVLRSLAR